MQKPSLNEWKTLSFFLAPLIALFLAKPFLKEKIGVSGFLAAGLEPLGVVRGLIAGVYTSHCSYVLV